MTIGCSVLNPPPAATLRARIDGAVVRLPGTGEGVARLVLVSRVKVDMAATSSGGDSASPPRRLESPQCKSLRIRNSGNAALLLSVGQSSARVLCSRGIRGESHGRSPVRWRYRSCDPHCHSDGDAGPPDGTSA